MGILTAVPSKRSTRSPRRPADDIAETARRALQLLGESARTGTATPEFQALCDPAIHVDASRRVFNPQVYDGLDGLNQLAHDIWEVWDGFSHEDVELTVSDNRVLSIHTIGGRGRTSGAEAKSRSALLFTIEHGVVVHVVAYADPDEAAQSLAEPQP